MMNLYGKNLSPTLLSLLKKKKINVVYDFLPTFMSAGHFLTRSPHVIASFLRSGLIFGFGFVGGG